MKTLSLTLALSLIASVSFAQVYRPIPQNPTHPVNPVNPASPGTPRPTPQPIIIPTNPTGTFQESMIIGPNGQITIIQQQGVDTFVTTY